MQNGTFIALKNEVRPRQGLDFGRNFDAEL
jgi:hypothetical protein